MESPAKYNAAPAPTVPTVRRISGGEGDVEREPRPEPSLVNELVLDAFSGRKRATPVNRWNGDWADGPTHALAERLVRWQMKELVQWNEGQAYTLDRATLIKMLDEALAGARPRTE